ncbi:transmembrane adaptor Erv26-domain-containing protein [Leucosporidium creatinivorum]|uniref:Transmembrane adaptor Erv26-domain-containing protein n=1 Tax=Leucosporidium creatinivorum TaxID=106004 RepID=A0A1Y2FAM3_9BASI|nr:transmembrane adaptor Erv26-domain-containing protein [Leucosporidium creatinivorum]
MVSALHALSFVAGTAAFLFVLLSLASGLLYVAEVIEEHAGLAKMVGQRTIYAIILILLVFHFVDGLPLYLTALGIFCHLVYLQNFSRTWPSISLTSPAFIASCILVIVSHFASFNYFSERTRGSNYGYNSYNRSGSGRWNAHASHSGKDDTFLDVATYFGVCVWLCPFFLFLSLSANDNVLPSASELSQPATPSQRPPGSPTHGRKQSSIMKNALSSAFNLVPNTLRPSALTALTQGRGGSSSQRSGLIATPARGSAPPSPSAFTAAGGGGWPQGSPSPSLAFGFQPPPGQGSGNASPRGPYSPSLGPEPSRRPSAADQGMGRRPSAAQGGGLRMPPGPSRRHTTEEGLGLGVGAGSAPMGLGFERRASELGREPSPRSPGGNASAQSALTGGEGGVRVGPAPAGMVKRRMA